MREEDHPEVELEIIYLETRGKNCQGLLVKADTAPEADHSELHGKYFDTYDRLKALPPSELQLILAEKDRQIKRLEVWVNSVVQSPWK